MSVHLLFHSVVFLTQIRLQKTPTMTEFGYLWQFLFKYIIMYEHMRQQSLTLHMFFKIKFLLYKKKNIVVDGCAWGELFHSMTGRARSL